MLTAEVDRHRNWIPSDIEAFFTETSLERTIYHVTKRRQPRRSKCTPLSHLWRCRTNILHGVKVHVARTSCRSGKLLLEKFNSWKAIFASVWCARLFQVVEIIVGDPHQVNLIPAFDGFALGSHYPPLQSQEKRVWPLKIQNRDSANYVCTKLICTRSLFAAKIEQFFQ